MPSERLEDYSSLNVIDFRLRFRTHQMLKPWNPDNVAPHFEQYVKLYNMIPRLSELNMVDFVKEMQNGYVSKGVVCGGNFQDNRHLIEIKTSDIGDRFFFFGGINPAHGIRKNLEELVWMKDNGFLGVNISPYIWGIKANAKELFPIYAFCEMNNLIAIVHGSLHYNRYESMWLGDPKYIDDIAIHFPQLKIVVSHAFNGFGVLGLAVAQKHPNIYMEYSALWPKYLPDATLKAINSYLKHRCLFGTDYPLVEFGTSVKAWYEAIKPEVRPLFFHANAETCLFAQPR